MQFEKLDIVNLVVVAGLIVGLVTAIFYGLIELATTISAGLLGYLGGFVKVPASMASKNNSSGTSSQPQVLKKEEK